MRVRYERGRGCRILRMYCQSALCECGVNKIHLSHSADLGFRRKKRRTDCPGEFFQVFPRGIRIRVVVVVVESGDDYTVSQRVLSNERQHVISNSCFLEFDIEQATVAELLKDALKSRYLLAKAGIKPGKFRKKNLVYIAMYVGGSECVAVVYDHKLPGATPPHVEFEGICALPERLPERTDGIFSMTGISGSSPMTDSQHRTPPKRT